MRPSPRRIFILTLRSLSIPLAVFLLWLSLPKDRPAGSFLQDVLLKQATSPHVIAAAILYFGMQLLGALRWRILLTAAGLPLPYGKSLALTLSGNFFSLIIPGGVSGDIVKVGTAGAAFPGKTAELALIDLLDRFVGLSGLFAAAILFLIPLVFSSRLLAGAKSYPVFLAFIAFAAALVLVTAMLWCRFFQNRKLHPGSQEDEEAQKPRRRILGVFRRFLAALEIYRNRRRALLTAFLVSILIHFMSGTAIYTLAQAASKNAQDRLSFAETQFVTHIANAAAILPVTPAGIGVRDAVLNSHDGADSEAGETAALAYTGIIVFWGIAGAFVYLAMPQIKPISQITPTINERIQ